MVIHLKLSPVPGRVVVIGPLVMAELNLIGGAHRVHRGRELHLQELPVLMPIHLHPKYKINKSFSIKNLLPVPTK